MRTIPAYVALILLTVAALGAVFAHVRSPELLALAAA
jgi:hypothetical protein